MYDDPRHDKQENQPRQMTLEEAKRDELWPHITVATSDKEGDTDIHVDLDLKLRFSFSEEAVRNISSDEIVKKFNERLRMDVDDITCLIKWKLHEQFGQQIS